MTLPCLLRTTTVSQAGPTTSFPKENSPTYSDSSGQVFVPVP